MLPLNNIDVTMKRIQSISYSLTLLGAQIFTRALGKSIAEQEFTLAFVTAIKNDISLLLHPVFDSRKPDNNIIYSWEHELNNAMLQLVQAGICTQYPDLKIIVHHA